jgi:predicted negative regulator of RcsB-dependent stress response
MRNFLNFKCNRIFALVVVLLGATFMTTVVAADQRNRPGSEELGKITSFLKVMDNYIQITKEFYGIASDQERAAAFAVMEIKTVYEQSGNKKGAIKELSDLLDSTKNRTIRNIIRFQLLDLYKQSGNSKAAMENLRSIINENLK